MIQIMYIYTKEYFQRKIKNSIVIYNSVLYFYLNMFIYR